MQSKKTLIYLFSIHLKMTNTMNWLAINLISAFLLPPFNLILLGMLGMFVLKRRPMLGKLLIIAALSLLYLLSTPFVAETALQTLEMSPTPNLANNSAQTIVVLGGGAYFNAIEYGGPTVGHATLERLRYAAHLHRLTGKPILVSGGDPQGSGTPEAAQMKAVLENDFRVPVKWTEEASDNTRQNAYNSFVLLKKEEITQIYLVTHAWHMPRAAREFEQAGFKVIPAATAYTTQRKIGILAFIPNARALQQSQLFLHEVIGMLWYRLNIAT